MPQTNREPPGRIHPAVHARFPSQPMPSTTVGGTCPPVHGHRSSLASPRAESPNRIDPPYKYYELTPNSRILSSVLGLRSLHRTIEPFGGDGAVRVGDLQHAVGEQSCIGEHRPVRERGAEVSGCVDFYVRLLCGANGRPIDVRDGELESSVQLDQRVHQQQVRRPLRNHDVVRSRERVGAPCPDRR